jgi:predicted dithiol-disulfide oxidoreductase (DUF899 family)
MGRSFPWSPRPTSATCASATDEVRENLPSELPRAPLGRNEPDGGMSWLRRHDAYEATVA